MSADHAASFETFFVQHHGQVLRYAQRRLPSPTAAEDLAAEVFTAAWQIWAADKSLTLPWLYRVASNKIADRYRSEERRAAVQVALFRQQEEAGAGPDHLERLALREALLQLSDRDREAITLHYWEGLAAPEIAEILGCTLPTAWAVLSRARKRLRRALADNTTQNATTLKEGSR